LRFQNGDVADQKQNQCNATSLRTTTTRTLRNKSNNKTLLTAADTKNFCSANQTANNGGETDEQQT